MIVTPLLARRHRVSCYVRRFFRFTIDFSKPLVDSCNTSISPSSTTPPKAERREGGEGGEQEDTRGGGRRRKGDFPEADDGVCVPSAEELCGI